MKHITETAKVTFPNGKTETITVYGGIAGRLQTINNLNKLYPCGNIRIEWNVK